jgi:predicted dehydrogenase
MDMMHVVYVAEAFLDAPIRRVSAHVIARTDDAAVEDIALVRLEADAAVALVNVGWGVGPGGMAVSGPDGRIEIAYEGGATAPFAPLSSVTLIRADGSREDRTPDLGAPPADGSRPPIDVHLPETFRSFFEAVAEGRQPVATAADGLRVLETTLAAYLSAATGRIVDLPLDHDHPVHRVGIAGLADVELDGSSQIARRRIFSVPAPRDAR